jgi:Na+/proline symporter
VQRYLAGSSVAASRWGLIFNAVFKIPMQFSILLLGVLLFVFYHFQQPPIFYNEATIEQVSPAVLAPIESQFQDAFNTRGTFLETALNERKLNGASSSATRAAILEQTKLMDAQRGAFKQAVSEVNPDADTQDADYIFLHFVLDNLPAGLVGLLVAVIFLAAMSSTASELNALASTTMIDGYKTLVHKGGTDGHYVWVASILTLVWGIVAVSFAMTLTLFENLIEAVNIIGSLFYGTILGLFLIAFFLKRIRGHAAFIAGVCAEAIVLLLYFSSIDIGYLWFNLIGCILAVMIALLVQSLLNLKPKNLVKSL